MFVLLLLLPIVTWSVSKDEISATVRYVESILKQPQWQYDQNILQSKTAIRTELARKYPKHQALFVLVLYRASIDRAEKLCGLSKDPRWAEQLKNVQSEFINLPLESEFSQVDDILKKMISEILDKDTSDEVNKILTEISTHEKIENVPVDLIVQLKTKLLPVVGAGVSDKKIEAVLKFSSPLDIHNVYNYMNALNGLIHDANYPLGVFFVGEFARILRSRNSHLWQFFSEDPIVQTSKGIFENLVQFKTVAGIPVTVGPKSLGTLIVPPRPAGFEDTVALVEDLMNLPTMIENLRLQAGNEKILADVDDTLVKILKKMKDEAKKADPGEIFVLLKDIHSKIKDWVNSKATVGPIKPVVPVSSTPVPTAAVIPTGPVLSKPTTIIPVKAATIASPVENEAKGEVDNVSPPEDSDITDSGSPDEKTKKKKKKSGSSKWLVVGLCVGLGVPFLIAVAVVLVKKYRTAAEAAQSLV